jgi:HSP20 family protein
MRMLVPRYDLAFRPSRSLLEEWFDPFGSMVECEDWMPASDITENDKSYVVTLEVPGIDMKKTDITFNDGMLFVRGEKEKESMDGESCHCAERYAGTFDRSFRIPGKIESDKIDATYKDGILKLTLPKAAESIPKKITVH